MATPRTSDDDQGDYPYFGYFKIQRRLLAKLHHTRTDIQRSASQGPAGSPETMVFRPAADVPIVYSRKLGTDWLWKDRGESARRFKFYKRSDGMLQPTLAILLVPRLFKKRLLEAQDSRRHRPLCLQAFLVSEWYKQYQNDPNIEFNHFLANPFEITERGPDTIRGILKAHVFLYEKAKEMLSKATPDEKSAVRFENYKIHPLYPSLVLIVDRFEL